MRKQYSANAGKHEELMSVLNEGKLNHFVQLRASPVLPRPLALELMKRQVELPRTKADRVQVNGNTVTIVIDKDNFAALFGHRARAPAAQMLLLWARAEEAPPPPDPAGMQADPSLGTKLQDLLMEAARSPVSKPAYRPRKQPSRKCKLFLSSETEPAAP